MAEYLVVGVMCGFLGFFFGFGAAVVADEMGRGRFFDDAP